MKRLLLFLLVAALPSACMAGHAAGLDLYYTHISGNTYRVSLTIYGNCHDQPNNNYSSLYSGTPQIAILDSATNTTWKTISLDLISDSTRDVSPYCSKYLDSTNCKNPAYPFQGYTRFVYSDTVTLPKQSAKWIFRFTSAMQSGCSGRLGRPAIDNLVGGNGTNVILEAMLNNTTANNSSPVFNNSLFTAYCVNTPSSYYQQARDPNNDSLVFELVSPLREVNSCNGSQALPFAAGYNPMMAMGYSFNPANGTMLFTPTSVQVAAVATKVYEYRAGKLVGYTMREKIFKVLGNCINTPPAGLIDTTAASLQGAIWFGNNIVACPGSLIKFSIPVADVNGDTIKATISGIPSGSNLTISNNNSPRPMIQFSWNTSNVAPGTYTFNGFYQDNGCPLKSEGIVTYTIIIDDGGSITPAVVSPTNCIQKAAVEYDVHASQYPCTLSVRQGNIVLNTMTSTAAGILADSLAPGTYTLELSAQGMPCKPLVTFTVQDSGAYPFGPTAKSTYHYCRNGEAVMLEVAAHPEAHPQAAFRWYDGSMNFLSSMQPIPPTNVSGTFTYYVSTKYNSCESAMDTVTVTIDSADCNYDVTVHNVITPNGDGKNDKWIIDNTGYYPNIAVQVFSKLGDKVFERSGYQNDWEGDNLPSGVYYYIVQLNGVNKTSGTETLKGYILIKR